MRLASVDIGTNTVRLLVVEVRGDSFEWLATDRAVVRLGEGLLKTGRLKDEAMRRTLDVLKRFQRRCEELKVEKVFAVATAAVREAANGDVFVKMVEGETGWRVKVITGEEEAYFTYLGVKTGLDLEDGFVVFDIGGGSTEYICACNGLKAKSLGMGVVKLTEEFVHSDPPLPEEVRAVEDRVRELLNTLDMRECEGKVVVGTAGTPTTLAAIDMKMEKYDPKRVHGYKLSLFRLEEMKSWLLSMTSAERLSIPGMEKGREDLIVVGVIIVVETLKFFNADEMVVSEWGIREGVIVDALNRGEG